MSLPELIANSPIPGTSPALASLTSAITTTGATTIKTTAAAPALLQSTGQFRIIVDSEIMLVTGGASTTTWTPVVRGVEGSTAATHLVGAPIYHDITREALLNIIIGLAVTSKVKNLGSVSGSITPDLSKGRIFKATTTGAVAIGAPTGLPSAISSTLYWEVELAGDNAITFPGVTAWRFGGEPPRLPAINRYTFFTDDGVSVYGVGSEGLPASVVQVTGATTGQTPVWSGTSWVPGTPSGGITKEAVEELIKELTILTGKHPMTITAAASSAGEVLLAASPTEATWEQFDSLTREVAQPRVLLQEAVTTNLTAEQNKWYSVTSASKTVTLPSGTVALAGERIVVENASTGKVKVTGPIGSASIITEELEPGEVVCYYSNEVASIWRVEGRNRPAATIEGLARKATPGASTPEQAVEGTVPTAGEAGVQHRVIFNLTGDGATKAWKLKHSLGTKAVTVSVQTTTSGKPKEQVLGLESLLGGSGKITATSVNEVEVVFTTAPALGKSYFLSVAG
jgi:hypothetical protein